MMKWILLPFEGFFDENDDKHGDDENALLSFFLYPLWGPRGPPAWAAWQLEAHWAPKEDPPHLPITREEHERPSGPLHEIWTFH